MSVLQGVLIKQVEFRENVRAQKVVAERKDFKTVYKYLIELLLTLEYVFPRHNLTCGLKHSH